MGFQICDFTRLRPFVYHVTSRQNAMALQQTRRVLTTHSLLQRAQRLDLLRKRRPVSLTLQTPDGPVVLKDQRPLIEANTALNPGWGFGDYVQYLNSFVFFWPGTDDGPIGPGRRLLGHYEADGPLVLRISTERLLSANPRVDPEFCPFNSGAPRYNSGTRAPRGPNLFSSAHTFPRRASEVVEVGFRGDIELPTLPSIAQPRDGCPFAGQSSRPELVTHLHHHNFDEASDFVREEG